jgi:hypothetical protein
MERCCCSQLLRVLLLSGTHGHLMQHPLHPLQTTASRRAVRHSRRSLHGVLDGLAGLRRWKHKHACRCTVLAGGTYSRVQLEADYIQYTSAARPPTFLPACQSQTLRSHGWSPAPGCTPQPHTCWRGAAVPQP